MAAGEKELQPFIGDGWRILGHIGRIGRGELFERLERRLLLGERALTAQAINRLAPGNRGEPRRRIPWDAASWPLLERRHHRILQRILGQREIA